MTVLVTGGGGFLGGAVVRQLLERGDAVKSFARGDYPELESAGVEVVRGDLADREAVIGAAAGCAAIVHVAARAGVWGSREAYRRANVAGTEHILEAARTHGIGRLVVLNRVMINELLAVQIGKPVKSCVGARST